MTLDTIIITINVVTIVLLSVINWQQEKLLIQYRELTNDSFDLLMRQRLLLDKVLQKYKQKEQNNGPKPTSN